MLRIFIIRSNLFDLGIFNIRHHEKQTSRFKNEFRLGFNRSCIDAFVLHYYNFNNWDIYRLTLLENEVQINGKSCSAYRKLSWC